MYLDECILINNGGINQNLFRWILRLNEHYIHEDVGVDVIKYSLRVDIDNLPKMLRSKRNSLTILSTKNGNINVKFDELHMVIDYLNNLYFQFSAIRNQDVTTVTLLSFN